MLVFVINQHGKTLMPTTPSKARKLLKQGKAKIVKYNPFTIQLLYGSSGYKQEVNIGIDLGAKHIGIAIQSQNKIIAKGEIELRDDVKSKIKARKVYRSSRRNRKTRYRKPRFQNRKRKEGWLPPSIQSRINNTFFWIDKFYSLLPNCKLNIEVGKFDVQKMMNPDIQGKEYQQGETYGYYDVRYYVFARDKYTCQVCKNKNKILRTHHIIYKSKGGSDKPSNLISVCTDCHTHENHQEGNVLWKWMMEKKKVLQYKEAPFMNSLRLRVFTKYPNANIVYGSWTTPKRKELGLDKTHYNDALAISGIEEGFTDNVGVFKIKQFRKKKRSLHEATPRKGRNEPNREAKRNCKNTKYFNGLYLNDKVRVFGKIGWISGFCSGGCYVKDIEDEYITIPDKKYKQVGFKHLEFINHNTNWQFISHL
jgi:hypothetical protein